MENKSKRNRAHQKPNKPENKGLDGKSLFYNNNGLFSDPFLERLPSIENDDFVLEHWDTDNTPSFAATIEWMRENWHELYETLPNLSEAQLEERWIQPILKKLGWEYEVQDRLTVNSKHEVPDYSLFSTKQSYLKARRSNSQEGYLENVLAVADAKAMKVNLDGSKLNKSNPSFQITWYMHVTNKDWGILTNGRHWRLYCSKSKHRHTTFYEIDLERHLAPDSTEWGQRDDNNIKYFFNFFRKESFLKKGPSSMSFLDLVFQSGEKYAISVETQLKGRAYSLVEKLAQGFDVSKNIDQETLDEIYENSLFILFRLMFILNCEAKGLFNIDRQIDYYSYSLNSICTRIRDEHRSGSSWANLPKTFSQLLLLFNLLENGDSKIGVHGFGKEAFSIKRLKGFSDYTIGDSALNDVLLDLAFTKEEEEYYFIDYKRLSADHLGSIFEELLEYKLVKDGNDGCITLVNGSGERRNTGSFYTPDYIVDYIVKETLAPLVHGLSVTEILSLKIADIAMGSAHFLLGVIKYLEEQIQNALTEEDDPELDPTNVRWAILHSCIYGVDKNPLAVELGKFSLWIYTARNGNELEPLEDQLIEGNSLSDDFKWDQVFKSVFESGGFSALTINPPYLGENDHKDSFDAIRNDNIWKYHVGKMDYWYFFVHKGLELIQENGRMGLIATDYWRMNEGAEKLRKSLENVSIERYVSFNNFKIFPNASGQHNMVLILDKEINKNGRANRYYLPDSTDADMSMIVNDVLSGEMRLFEKSTLTGENGDWSTRSSNGLVNEIIEKMASKSDRTLGEVSKIFTGIQTGPDKLNSRSIQRIDQGIVDRHSLDVGRGVFVISTQEYNIIAPSKEEKALIKKFMPAGSIVRGSDIKWDGNEHIIYTTRNNATNSKKIPSIISHLKPCRVLMDERRETLNGDRKWYQIHWPRDEKYFLKPGIVAVRMGKTPTFAWTKGGIYFDLAVNMIIPKNKKTGKAILHYLNSEFVASWLRHCGKMKGDSFQLDVGPLKSIPIPDFTKMEGKINQQSVIEFSELWFQVTISDIVKAA